MTPSVSLVAMVTQRMLMPASASTLVMRAIWPSWFSANTAIRLTALIVSLSSLAVTAIELSITRLALPSLTGKVPGGTRCTLGFVRISARNRSAISRLQPRQVLDVTIEPGFGQFDVDRHFVEPFQHDLIVPAHGRQAHQHAFDLLRINVHAAHDQHVVGAAGDAVQAPVRAAARARAGHDRRDVA